MDGLVYSFVLHYIFVCAFVLNCFCCSIHISVFNFLTNQHAELADYVVEMLLSHVLLLVYVFPLSQAISIRLKRKKVNSDLPCSERLWDSDCDLMWLIIILCSSEFFLFTLIGACHLLFQVFLTKIFIWYSYHRIIWVKKIKHPVAHKQGSGMAYNIWHHLHLQTETLKKYIYITCNFITLTFCVWGHVHSKL